MRKTTNGLTGLKAQQAAQMAQMAQQQSTVSTCQQNKKIVTNEQIQITS